MKISRLQLEHFRNIECASLDLGLTFNLFFGRNAQGKTNILEAIGLLASGKSFRTSDFRDTIHTESERARVRATADGASGSDGLQVELDRSRKTFFRNGKRTTPGGFQGLAAVLFSPEEILLLRDSPSGRRRYLDDLIVGAHPPHRTTIRGYERVVSHRNRLLQKIRNNDGGGQDLGAWDAQLAEFGAAIVLERDRWCRKLNELLPDKYAAIAPEDKPAEFFYRPHTGETAMASGYEAIRDVLLEELERRRDDERERGLSLVGPHRDDLEARLGKAPLKQSGSQGQHRTFVLALKIAEVELLREHSGEMPLLLLDDVAGELDTDRGRLFFKYLEGLDGQIFSTATDAEALKGRSVSGAARFCVCAGRAIRER